jgi:hypothetical protein
VVTDGVLVHPEVEARLAAHAIAAARIQTR